MRWRHVRVWLNLAKAFACTFSPMCWRISTYCKRNSKLVSKTIILKDKPTYFAQTPLLDSSCAVVYQPRSAHGTANDTIHQPTVWKRWCLGTGPSGWSWWDTWNHQGDHGERDCLETERFMSGWETQDHLSARKHKNPQRRRMQFPAPCRTRTSWSG